MLRKRRQQQLRLNKLKKNKQQQHQLAGERKRKLLLCIFNRGRSAIFHFEGKLSLYARIVFLRLVAELSNEFLMCATHNKATPTRNPLPPVASNYPPAATENEL